MDRNILNYIPEGKKNAISVQRLAEITGAKSQRCLRDDVRALRKSGELICSCTAGYYRPATRDELDDFIKRMEKHAIAVFQAIASARKERDQIEGQQRFENL